MDIIIAPHPWKLFLDDERFPPDDDPEWIVRRSVQGAMETIEDYGLPYYMTLDHDLGEGELTGMDFAKRFVEYLLDNKVVWNGNFYVHSQNPVGKKNIESYLTSYMKADIYR